MHLWTKLKSNDFLRHNGIFFVGSLVVAALNYLYYPILGRLLPTARFGEVQTLVSLFIQINIFLAVVTNVAVNVVANEPDNDQRNRITIELERLATLVTLITAVIGLIFIAQLRSFLQFNDSSPFVVLALAVVISAPLALQGAYLRGRAAFGKQSLNSIIGSVTKLLASIIFVLIGFGTAGAIGGLVAGQLAALILARQQTHTLGLHKPKGITWRFPDLSVIKPQLPYAGLVLIVSLVTTYLYSVDIIVVKHYFDAQTAGLYAGIATIGRIIYFLTGSIAVVLLTSVKRSATPKTNRRLLIRSIFLQLLIGGAALISFTFFPDFFINLLIGDKYLPMANLLPRLSLALFVIAGVGLLFNYDLALRRASAAAVAILGAITTFVIVATHHSTPAAVVNAILVSGLSVIVFWLANSARLSLKQHFGNA